MPDQEASTPFHFIGCFELQEILGRRATDAQQLLTGVEEAALECIYFHTHSYFLRGEHGSTLFSSDFAVWAASSLHDRVLGERLGLLDPFEFKDLESLRSAIVTTIDDHLKTLWNIPRVTQGEAFEFLRSHIIEVDMGIGANSLSEFRAVLSSIDRSALFFHICEAKVRKGRSSGDFVEWIASDTGLGLQVLADQVSAIQPLGLTLEEIRSRIVEVLDAWLAGPADHRAALST